MASSAKKLNFKDMLEGNELDLSMCSLSAVPVKELSLLPKATHIELSCNLLTLIPEQFCTLTHLVKVDLSKNQLTALPASLGRLVNLQWLDCYQNKITTLPVSMAYLSKLKWLDMKGNPLEEKIQKVVGDCLDERQCKDAAKWVVQYMKIKESELEREKQKRLKKEREEAALQAKVDEEEKKKKKMEKQVERERRRLEWEEARRREREGGVGEAGVATENGGASGSMAAAAGDQTKKKYGESGRSSALGHFTLFVTGLLVLLLAVIIGLHLVCDGGRQVAGTQQPQRYPVDRLLPAACSRYNGTVRPAVERTSAVVALYSSQLGERIHEMVRGMWHEAK